jgi:methanogenic corrinoid protein MtbC1
VNDAANFHAAIIESSARALAAHATELLLERRPSAHAFGQPAFRSWQDHLAGRLLELAGAMRAGEPGLFGDQLHWGKIAFAARGLDAAELEASTDALHEALIEGLPPGASEAVSPFLAAARAALKREVRSTAPAIAGPHGELASRYLVALLEGDRRQAIGMVLDALDEGLSPRDALVHVLVPVAREVGRMWHLGEVTIGEEHFTTTTASLLLGVVRQRMKMLAPSDRCAVIASVPGNRHDLAGRIAGLLLEAAGWRVIDMGVEMPAPDLVRSVGDFEADVVVLSVMLTTQLDTAQATVNALKADERAARAAIVVGGHVFDQAPTLWKRMGTDAHARTLGQITEIADAAWKARAARARNNGAADD